MSIDSIICQRKLDEERGTTWVCRCPWCQEKRKELEGRAPAAEEPEKLSEDQSEQR